MALLNWILLAAGGAVRAGWAGTQHAAAWLAGALDWGLSPVLSPVLGWINPWCTRAAGVVYAALQSWPGWVGLVLISAAAGAAMVGMFRCTSNQAAIRQVRDDIRAGLLVLRLFKDDLGVAVRAQRDLLWALLRLQGRMLVPLAIMALPVMLLMAQMNRRYQQRALHVGEHTLVHLRLHDDATLRSAPELAGAGIAVEVGPIGGGGQVLWRVRALEDGQHQLILTVDGQALHKDLDVGSGRHLVSSRRPQAGWVAQMLYPAEPPLPAGLPVQAIDIDYPTRASRFSGADWWMLWFFVLSLVFGGVTKFVFKVAM